MFYIFIFSPSFINIFRLANINLLGWGCDFIYAYNYLLCHFQGASRGRGGSSRQSKRWRTPSPRGFS